MAYLGRVKPTETTSSVLRSTYTGNGSTTTYALPGPVANETSIIATINGVTQQDAAYSTDGSNIIFVAAPALGDSIEIRTLSAVAMSYAPSAGSVVTGVIADGAVTSAKLASGAAVANIGSRAITGGQLPVGSVIQTVVTNYTTYYTNSASGASFIDVSGFSASITPTSSTSKILVLCQLVGVCTYASSTSLLQCVLQIADASNNKVFAIIDQAIPGGQSGQNWASYSGFYLHSPATTSSCTYKLQYKMGSTGLQINNYNTAPSTQPYSSIILMEIAQ